MYCQQPSTTGFRTQVNLSPEALAHAFPLWRNAVDAAKRSMGSLQCNGQHQGNVLFAGFGIALVPLHLLISSSSRPIAGEQLTGLLKQLTISYCEEDKDVCYARSYRLLGVAEYCCERDFAVLVCDKHNSSSPEIAYSLPSQFLFAEINARGEFRMSIVESCSSNFWEEGFCAYSPTQAGSSGGCYFDISGALIAVHLSRSTGQCGFDTGLERRGVLAKDLIRSSEIMSQSQRYCLELSRLPLCTQLLPPKIDTVCAIEEKGVVQGTIYGTNGQTCSYFEIRHGVQRSIGCVIRTPKLRTYNCAFELKAMNGNRPINVHGYSIYENNTQEFYRAAAEVIYSHYLANTIGGTIEFEFRKADFLGIREYRHQFLN